MPKVERSVSVPYSAEQMYDLVNSVEHYPEFLSGCVGSRVISRTEEQQEASIDIAKLGIRKTFSTRNSMIPNREIILSLLNGPFKKLNGQWRFVPKADGSCQVEFKIDFEFGNPILQIALRDIFGGFMGSMVQSFIKRADDIYGR